MKVRRAARLPALDEVPLDRIADLIEGARTVRFTGIAEVAMARRAVRSLREDGFEDYDRHLRLQRIVLPEGLAELLQTGPDVLYRLRPTGNSETGTMWEWKAPAQPNWATERAETVATIRQRAQPTSVTAEVRDGEELQRFSLRIKLSAREKDPLLASAQEGVRLGRTRRLTVEVWLTGDGHLRRFSEQYRMSRAQARPGDFISYRRDQWDFGLDLSWLAAPTAHEIVDRREPQGVTVLIDDQVSPY